MTDQVTSHAATVVAMPPGIDYGSVGQAYDQLNAVLITGAPVVIADFTLTTSCDCAALRRLLAIQSQADARHAEFRIAIPLPSPVRRILRITGLEQQFQLFPTAAHAAAASHVPAS